MCFMSYFRFHFRIQNSELKTCETRKSINCEMTGNGHRACVQKDVQRLVLVGENSQEPERSFQSKSYPQHSDSQSTDSIFSCVNCLNLKSRKSSSTLGVAVVKLTFHPKTFLRALTS